MGMDRPRGMEGLAKRRAPAEVDKQMEMFLKTARGHVGGMAADLLKQYAEGAIDDTEVKKRLTAEVVGLMNNIHLIKGH
jgi:hypothetical protein